MIKYAKIISEETGEVEIANMPASMAIEQGYTEQDVTQSEVDTKWYLTASIDVEEYKKQLALKRQESFEQDFFKITLNGVDMWIKRHVTMKDGTICSFLYDMAYWMEKNITAEGWPIGRGFLYYATPDFTKELTPEYLLTLQRPNPNMSIDDIKVFYAHCGQRVFGEFFGRV